MAGEQIAAELLANHFGNRANSLHTLALAAELVVINHFSELRDARFQRLLAILIEEKFRISQARAHHALIAANHEARIIRTNIAHHQKLIRELTSCIKQREILLIGLHRKNQALLRHIKKLPFKFADKYIGPLDQCSDFIE